MAKWRRSLTKNLLRIVWYSRCMGILYNIIYIFTIMLFTCTIIGRIIMETFMACDSGASPTRRQHKITYILKTPIGFLVLVVVPTYTGIVEIDFLVHWHRVRRCGRFGLILFSWHFIFLTASGHGMSICFILVLRSIHIICISGFARL